MLFSAIKPSKISRTIQAVQRRADFDDIHACWHHAALYVGKGVLCEATRDGVRPRSIFDYVTDHRIKLRRRLDLDEVGRLLIVVEALQMQDLQYDSWSAMKLYLSSFRGTWSQTNRLEALPSDTTICSALCNSAYGKAHSLPPVFLQNRQVAPADLSLTPNLQDVVGLRWVAV